MPTVWDEVAGEAKPNVWDQVTGNAPISAEDAAAIGFKPAPAPTGPLTFATPRQPTNIADVTGGGPPVSAGKGDVMAPLWEGLGEFDEAKDRPLMHIVPELTPEEMDTLRKGATPAEQQEAGIAQGVAQNINALTTPQNIALMVGTMGLAGTPRIARAVALYFSATMAKHDYDLANQLGEELGKLPQDQDPLKIGQLIGDGIVTTGFTGATAFAGLRGERTTSTVPTEQRQSANVPAAGQAEAGIAPGNGASEAEPIEIPRAPEAEPAGKEFTASTPAAGVKAMLVSIGRP